MPSGEFTELGICVSKEAENRLVEVVAACDDAVHVVLLVLYRTEQHRVLEIDHRRHPTPGRTKEQTLRLGGRFDRVIGRTEELPQQLRLGHVEGSLQMGSEKAVLDVHSRVQREFGDLAKDDRLIGRLL